MAFMVAATDLLLSLGRAKSFGLFDSNMKLINSVKHLRDAIGPD